MTYSGHTAPANGTAPPQSEIRCSSRCFSGQYFAAESLPTVARHLGLPRGAPFAERRRSYVGGRRVGLIIISLSLSLVLALPSLRAAVLLDRAIEEISDQPLYLLDCLLVRVLRLQPGHKYCRLGDLAKEVGWNHQDAIRELEEKRKEKAKVAYDWRKQLTKLRVEAEKVAEEKLGSQLDMLAPIKY